MINMPIDTSKIIEMEKQEQEQVNKLTPRVTKSQSKKSITNLTHYVILSKGKQVSDLLSKDEALVFLDNHPELELPIMQKLLCFVNVPCSTNNCGKSGKFFKYRKHNIIYRCENNHDTIISEYA